MVNELLNAFESSTEKVGIEKSLIQLLEEIKKIVSSSEHDSQSEDLINKNLVTALTGYLIKHNEERLNFLILEIFAEIAKTDSGRLLCVDAKIIKLILGCLSCRSSDPTSNISFQACRVLGNICFESDSARNMVKELGGEVLLLKLLEELCSDNKGSQEHLRVACGAFLNTIADHETLQLSVLSLGVLDVCCRIMKTFHQHDGLMKVILNIFELLFDNLEEINDSLQSDDFLECLLVLLKQTNDQEIIDSVFQILSTASENDKSKLALSSTSFPEKLCELIEERENETEVKFTDLASDFIVLLLTGDEGMDTLFQNGSGKVFLKLRSWLSTSKSIKLQTTAAFALCNIARSDKNCIFFVESGVVDDILAHLSYYPVLDKQPVLQHALIGTLTNLSITGVNKSKMIEKGTIDKCLSYLDSESLTVIFKSLGAIRMLLDKNCKVACQLGGDESFLSRLNNFSSLEEHEGIRCESWRIVASIIKNARDNEVMNAILKHNLGESLLKLFQSKHMIMKNEAILSLIILTSSLDKNPFENNEKFCEELKAFLSSKDPLPEEILSNLLVLIHKCQRIASIKSAFVVNGVCEVLERYKDHSDERLRHMVDEILLSF